MPSRGCSVVTWSITRTHRGVAPTTSISVAQISGMSPKPTSRAAVIGRSLDDLIPEPSKPTSLRWVCQHMIEEYARHNGHADLIRERIDGVTGS